MEGKTTNGLCYSSWLFSDCCKNQCGKWTGRTEGGGKECRHNSGQCNDERIMKQLDCCSLVQTPLFYFLGKSRSQSLEDAWRWAQSKLLGAPAEAPTVSDGLRSHSIDCCAVSSSPTSVQSSIHSMLPSAELFGDAGFIFQGLEHFSKDPAPAYRFFKNVLFSFRNTNKFVFSLSVAHNH